MHISRGVVVILLFSQLLALAGCEKADSQDCELEDSLA